MNNALSILVAVCVAALGIWLCEYLIGPTVPRRIVEVVVALGAVGGLFGFRRVS